ncbi:NADH-quinone oxidoreductase subunit NuoN [Larsenimonas rhizosphaerae]|uniref:NADH-quinone oxidoreductase subunit NuoN n=1 Tax=Larsenimonas rhizosphaerae TaxID=2944682 RepID=UPI0020336713|nr:NADH-quinone oxidoreductase subunit NuoN [Larsenimonas rhizosphaerae]MCM2131554.1 NADH-quinone oxidoreductase subunit NuoN [Larsenimonas rhizosphaerae]
MNLTTSHLIALLPLMLVCATVVIVMLAVAWRRNHFMSATLTVIGLNAALLALIPAAQVAPIQVTPLLMVDHYSLFYMGLILVAALACTTLAYAYLETLPDQRDEFYMLLGCSVAGALVLVASQHLTSLFIGLELMSVPLYGLSGYAFKERTSLESGIKYMVLSAMASAFLLFGMALLYAESGTLSFTGLGQQLSAGGLASNWVILGVGMMVVGLGFKLSIAPFHLWTPDVYEGAPAPVSAFLATVSKVAVFAMLMRLFSLAPATADGWLHTIIAVLAVLSMVVGNLLALMQSNLKRIIGYSSIAHLGYLLTALVASDGLALEATAVYLVTYVATVLGAFGVITLVSSPYRGADAGLLYHYRGLFWRRPYLTAVLTVMMLSLAGIPMTAGFIGKFYVFSVGVESSLWWLVGGVVLGSALGLYYYLRVMVTLYLSPAEQPGRDAPHDWAQQVGGLMVLVLAVLVLIMGVYPQPLIDLAQMAGLQFPI